ncbi:MAG TPA: Gfo/Idh/MocA family oxidoreductase [Allosphingosinicella sp.]|jgi:predicted dehydrogenase
MPIRIAIIGYGKIARDQHIPSIAADPRFELVAISTRSADPGLGLPCFADPAELFDRMNGRLDAVAICTPPSVRHAIAHAALRAGLAVLLEKPPAATLGEIEDLERLARAGSRTLYASWHSQHAAAVPRAAELLAGQRVARLRISWLEDVRKWHPGQEWIWSAGGFGVFDPGINALSIATRILPMPLFVTEARLLVPANKQAPIAAALTFQGGDMRAELDWRYEKGEQWTIRVETEAGCQVELRDGGATLLLDGTEQPLETRGEYPSIYNRFAELIAEQAVDVDREPLRIVADAYLIGERELTDPFE